MGTADDYLQVSIWLLPEQSNLVLLSAHMKVLAEKFKAPIFEPHLTLYSTKVLAKNLTIVKENLKTRVKDFAGLTLIVLGVGQNQALFKTLFLQLQNSKQLNGLYGVVKTILGKYGNYEIDPHLSLLYKEGLNEDQKSSSVKDIKFPEEIKFDKVAIKVSGHNDNFGKDISKWTYEVLD